MTKPYKACQSCAMPFKHDPQGGGTEADGAKSVMYCSYCYREGKFADNFETAKEMQDFCITKLCEMKYPKI
ncbi:MAG: zinc ribbon domain-containing protein, partial [Planctomycetaceae bacterium]|nr:zinc ribbon domain-containing protein [Planctomycetaceae bacterium]